MSLVKTARTSALERAPQRMEMGNANPNGMEVHVPKIIEDECVGCNLCALVCPVTAAITMEQVHTGLPPMSWKQKTSGTAGSSAPHA